MLGKKMGNLAFRAISVFLLLSLLAGAPLAEEPQVPDIEAAFKQLVKQVRPYVATVVAETDFSLAEENSGAPAGADFPRAVVDKRIGSGLIADAQGLVLTRRSVVDGMERLFVVIHTGDTLAAKLLGYDEDFDIALLQIPRLSISNPLFAHVGAVMEGSWVMILANSLNQKPGVSVGIIRTVLENGFLHVAANIWPGSIGAPVFNFRGQVVGIVAAKMRRSQFAHELSPPFPADECLVIPISSVLPRVRQIAQEARAESGWVGMSVTQYPGERGKPTYKVTFVYRESPAARAGIHLGDEVVAFNGKPVSNLRQLANAIRELSAGDSVSFVIRRSGQLMERAIRVEKRPPLYVLQRWQREQTSQTGVSFARAKRAWPAQPISRTEVIRQRIVRLENELRTLKQMLKQPPKKEH